MSNKSKSVLVLIISLTLVILSIHSIFSSLILQVRHLREDSHASKDEKSDMKVPKILHSLVLGDSPPQYMIEFTKFSAKIAKAQGFDVMLWRDEDVEKLVDKEEENGFKGLKQTWEYIKSDTRSSRYAKMADFMRTLIMWSIGGVYFDADVISCGSLDFMTNQPGTVSFPGHGIDTREVNGHMMSSPPHHRLMELALETFVNEGPEIATFGNMFAAGPIIFGQITDKYFDEVGIKLPSLSKNCYRNNEAVEGKIEMNDGFWDLRIADVRFAQNYKKKALYHIEFRTWLPGRNVNSACTRKPELIDPYFDSFCALSSNVRKPELFWEQCGKDIKDDTGQVTA